MIAKYEASNCSKIEAEVLSEKDVLKNLAKSQENPCSGVSS